MDRAFSVDDIPESFWPASSAPPPPSSDASSSAGGAAAAMNRSSSEWFFQKFLEEASLLSPNSAPGPSIPANPNSGHPNTTPSTTVIGSVVGDSSAGNLRNDGVQIEPPALASNQPTIQTDPEKYAAHLKQQLEIYCKAVALSRGSNAVPLPQETPLAPDAKSQTSDSSQFGSQSSVKANSGTSVQNKVSGITNSASPARHVLQSSEITIKPATSYSDQSEDDDLEGEAENLDHLDPAEAKKMRRMLSNRESARRSRRRKQAHLGELEQQVSQLRVENSSLLKNLQDINQKYTNAAVDNRVLKADVETLRAKVKMAEDKVKRSSYIGPVTSSVYQPTMTDMSPPLSVPYSNSPSDAASDMAVPLHDDLNQYFVSHPPPPATQMATPHTATLNPTSINMVQTMPVQESGVHGKTGRTPSMLRVASLEHLQKRICGQNGPIGPSGLIGPSEPSGLIGPSGPSGPWDSLGPGGRGGQK